MALNNGMSMRKHVHVTKVNESTCPVTMASRDVYFYHYILRTVKVMEGVYAGNTG